jgi:hypothetical protein
VNKPDNIFDLSKAEKKLFQLLLIYCVAISMCRLIGPSLRFISLLDWMMFRKTVTKIPA